MEKIKGMTFGYWSAPEVLLSSSAKNSLNELKNNGTKWIALAFPALQESTRTTRIFMDYSLCSTDYDIISTIKYAHDIGMKVCLKPVLDIASGEWRAEINLSPNEWKVWFGNYKQFLSHYLKIAERYSCEMFCIGCEMLSSEEYESEWLEIIQEARKLYKGYLIYNANFDCDYYPDWIRNLDFYGISAYFPLDVENDDEIELYQDSWNAHKKHLLDIYNAYNLPIIFMEIGCKSEDDAMKHPWDYSTNELVNHDVQMKFYESAFRTFWLEEWFQGFFGGNGKVFCILKKKRYMTQVIVHMAKKRSWF